MPDVVPFAPRSYADPIPGIMPFGTTTLLAGASQLGKTAMVASWAVRFRDGKTICGHETNPPVSIGVLVVDRRSTSHRQWFAKAGWPDVPMYSYRDDPLTKWEEFLQRPSLKGLLLHGLEELEKQGVGRGALVIVDPIAPFIAGNLNDYKHTLAGLGVIDQLCGERNITLFGIAHMAKQKSEKERYSRPQDRILGSTALGGFTDTQMYMLGPDDTDHGHYELGWIPHNAPAEEFRFNRDDNGLFIPAPFGPKETEAHQVVLAIFGLPPHQFTTAELIAVATSEQYGVAKRTAERAIGQLVAMAKIERKGRGLYALIPQGM